LGLYYLTPHVKDHPHSSPPNLALEGKKQKKGPKKKEKRSSTYFWKAAFKSLNE
jgi:hypothetical protein